MCGICGAADFSGAVNAAEVVRRMTPTMQHRGPDDEGFADFGFRISDLGQRAKSEAQRGKSEGQGDAADSDIGGALSIGMRRLSIIDLEGGHQPIFNEDGMVGAVLNGEIYNFQELQNQLKDRGHIFHTRSDSEVVAHAYEEWGPESVERFEGMFAIAVWDGRGAEEGGRSHSPEGTLFLARDRMGIKPLYYYVELQSPKSKVQSHFPEEGVGTSESGSRKRFLFASEVRTLLASGVVPRRLSRAALESYLLFGSVSEPMSLVDGVLSLPPGHTMTIALGDSTQAIKPKPYWSLGSRIAEVSSSRKSADNQASNIKAFGNGHAKVDSTSRNHTAARVRTLLEESVRSHLIADVPVGVFLSGGIDSTSLAALASREVSGIHTFTVAFAEKEFSEAAIARRTAARFGTTHQEVMLSGDEMLARLDEAVGSLDQPTMDGINTYFVSWSARQAGLKVTLSGLGGDEVFGGYSSFRRTPKYQRLAAAGAHFPGSVRSAMSATFSVATSAAGAGSVSRFKAGDVTRKISALWNSPDALPDPFYFGRALFTPAQVSSLLTRAESVDPPLWWNWLSESAKEARELDSFAAVSCMEMQSYLVNTLLRDTDSMSMAHSLEVRVPFLAHRLVEFVTSLPQERKLRKGVPKALLVAALGDLLPDEVVNQTKRGFTFPWADWLRGPLKERIENGLAELSPALKEAIDADGVWQIWQDYLDGKTSWSRPWSLYVLNEWVKRNLEN
ncbi:MAG TPA: asparagine synthase-related protein [Pyrinomonadaceae bacterium]|nr:asparagine synthase-related protein [Pyrinomonadaceae bacterium]